MTPIYEKIMSMAEAGETCAGADLEHRVWDPTPWIIDVYMGDRPEPCGVGCDEYAILRWCKEHIGPQSSPIHGQPGAWHMAGATINGWTWIGFDTERHMNAFLAAWPDNGISPNHSGQARA